MAVLVTVVGPVLKVLPDAGFETTVAFPQLSFAITEKVTVAVQLPGSIFWVKLVGQVIIGDSPSTTVTTNEQEEVLPLPSVAVLVTVVGPGLKVLPETGFETTVAFPQLSLVVT